MWATQHPRNAGDMATTAASKAGRAAAEGMVRTHMCIWGQFGLTRHAAPMLLLLRGFRRIRGMYGV